VLDIEDYLKETFGAPELNIDDGSANSFDLPPSPGIVLMDFPDGSYTGHVTVWMEKVASLLNAPLTP